MDVNDEVIVKMQNKKSRGGPAERGGGLAGAVRVDMNQELVIVKMHKKSEGVGLGEGGVRGGLGRTVGVDMNQELVIVKIQKSRGSVRGGDLLSKCKKMSWDEGVRVLTGGGGSGWM